MDIPAIKNELRQALAALQRRGLRQGVKLCAELLVSTCPPTDPRSSLIRVTKYSPGSGASSEAGSFGSDTVEPFDFEADEESEQSSDAYVYARALFDAREYARAAVYLDKAHQGDVTAFSPLNFFLRCYSLYLDGERQKLSERSERAPTAVGSGGGPANPHLSNLSLVLSERQRSSSFDAFASYLQGVVYRDLDRKQEAKEAYVRALRGFPLLTSAWVDLLKLCGDSRKTLAAIAPSLPAHWCRPIFTALALLETQVNAPALVLLREISGVFPLSTTLQAAVAKGLYQLRDIPASAALFEKVRQADPCRLEDTDIISNVLYVMGDGPGLSALCRDVMRVDRNRVETAIVTGNYFSLKGQRERAVAYFKRALKIDALSPNPTVGASCWTLLGHEFVELRNTNAAIECYRRGCEASGGRDFRAWFGLGNSYELLKLPAYASYYYRKAVALRPYDPRLWMALGRAYESLDKPANAVACYSRGAQDDRTGQALLKLAKLESARASAPSPVPASTATPSAALVAAEAALRRSRRDAAKRHYAAYIRLMEQNNAAHTAEVADALLYLAEQALVSDSADDIDSDTTTTGGRADYEACIAYATRVTLMPLAAHAKRARQLILEAQQQQQKAAMQTQTQVQVQADGATAQAFFMRANPFGRALGAAGGPGADGALGPTVAAVGAGTGAAGGAVARPQTAGHPLSNPLHAPIPAVNFGRAGVGGARTSGLMMGVVARASAAAGTGAAPSAASASAGQKRQASDADDYEDNDDDGLEIDEDDDYGDEEGEAGRAAAAANAAPNASGDGSGMMMDEEDDE